MDVTAFKKLSTRGLTYNYYRFIGQADKPTLVFLHGFPNTASDWHKQVTFFQGEGYSLVVPDMLGYGGTDKPSEPEAYLAPALAKDIIDVLDAEQVEKSILIGHDWYVLL